MSSRIRWGCLILLLLLSSVVGVRFATSWAYSGLPAVSAVEGPPRLLAPPNPPNLDGSQNAPSAKPPKAVEKLNLDGAVPVALPVLKQDLEAASFSTPDGRKGWVVKIPGGRPLATPAYANGKLFIGGGYGSHEFYAFDSETGKVIWKISTGDDGPTAAVVEDGYVAFNTESCTLMVVDEKTGKVVWQEWLGDPLMSQPAIDKGRVFIAFPGGQRDGERRARGASFHPKPATPGGSHRLLAADLRTGQHIWEQAIAGEVISAPILSDDVVYFTTFDGTSYAIAATDGAVIWVKKNAGTSAPVIAADQLVMTRKEMRGTKSYEGLARIDSKKGGDRDGELLAPEKAGYLDAGAGGGVALSPQSTASLDSLVGFAAPPPAAKLAEANQNVGVSTVVGAWAYQGSRAAVSKGQVLNAQGRYLNSFSAASGKETWRREIVSKDLTSSAQVFSPPALGRDYMYLAGGAGHLVAVRQRDGALGFAYALKQPMAVQPVLVRGNVCAGTANGLVICLKTGRSDADGWYAWGGNAQHNKVEK